MELVSVAALSENRVIGNDDDVPWDLPEDKRQYRARIAGHPVIFGRRTFEMFDDLPGSAGIVLSRTEREYDAGNVHHAGSVAEAKRIAESLDDVAYVIGGAEIYELFLPHVDRMVLSLVPGEYEGDAFYPAWDEDEWRLESETEYDGFTLTEWVRRT